MPIFAREKSIQVKLPEPGRLEVTASLKDNFHEIETLLVFEPVTKTILEAQAKMHRTPFDICPEAGVKLDRLVGLALKPGISKIIGELVGSTQGCAHLTDLVLDSLRAVFQATGFCLFETELPFEERLEKIKAANMGICYTYSNLHRNPVYIGPTDI